jgi:hypothetical protein
VNPHRIQPDRIAGRKALDNGAWIRRYYLVTPLFFLLDSLFGYSFRISGLPQPGYRYAWYGFCLLCALGCYAAARFSALIAIVESSVNLLILLASVLLPIVYLGDLGEESVPVIGLNGDNILNFLLTGGILLSVFYSAQHELYDSGR